MRARLIALLIGSATVALAEPRGNVPAAEALPRAVDNSVSPCFPPIFYQGDLNSCTSVAVTYYQLTYMTGRAQGWDQRNGGPALRFSPLWTFNLINDGNNRGTFQARAYAALAAHGAVTLQDMPYHSATAPVTNFRRWPDDPNLWQRALAHRIEKFGTIQEANVVSLLRRLKQRLADGEVLTATTGIDGWNRRRVADNPHSRLDNPYVGELIATAVARTAAIHCVAIVGYNDDLWVDLNGNGEVDPGEKGALKIANSWGTVDWNRGFRWLHYSALYGSGDAGEPDRQPALVANRAYWMEVRPAYQPELVVQVDLPPMFRNEFSLSVGVGPAGASGPVASAPNFAFDFNGGRYGVGGRGVTQRIRTVLDLTQPARELPAAESAIFVRVARIDGRVVVPQARLVEPASGVVHELQLQPTGRADTFVARAPAAVLLHTRSATQPVAVAAYVREQTR